MELLDLLWIPVGFCLQFVEYLLFFLIDWYDAYCYTPLQTSLSPLVTMVPRQVELRGQKVTVFTANIVSWARTCLVVPIAWCLKYNHPIVAFLCVILHDFLDHLDGIVAKVQKSVHGQIDDPLLGGFMDAFCDKIVNCISLWTILVVTDFDQMTYQQAFLFTGVCVVIIAYEFILGIVRVQDYFQAYYEREHCVTSSQSPPNVAAVMEGKLKEKLESMGIGFLCLAQACANPATGMCGMIGIVCLVLSIRLAHASLQHKLKPRKQRPASVAASESNTSENTTGTTTAAHLFKESDDDASNVVSNTAEVKDSHPAAEKLHKTDQGSQTDFESETVDPSSIHRHMSIFDDNISDDDADEEKSDNVSEKDFTDDERSKVATLTRSHSVPSWKPHVAKVDKVYTVGCFDLFHEGHRILLERLNQLGTQVIVGVHDSRSIFKLKKKVPIDSTTKRMGNVKKYASIAFCIHGTDPTPYLKCMHDADENCTSMYVRGNDMPNFPSRKFIESVMPVHFLPYTEYVSSTKIRKEVYNASMFGPHALNDDDHDHAAMFY